MNTGVYFSRRYQLGPKLGDKYAYESAEFGAFAPTFVEAQKLVEDNFKEYLKKLKVRDSVPKTSGELISSKISKQTF